MGGRQVGGRREAGAVLRKGLSPLLTSKADSRTIFFANSLFKSPLRNQKLLQNPADRCRHTFTVLREARKPQGTPNKSHGGWLHASLLVALERTHTKARSTEHTQRRRGRQAARETQSPQPNRPVTQHVTSASHFSPCRLPFFSWRMDLIPAILLFVRTE